MGLIDTSTWTPAQLLSHKYSEEQFIYTFVDQSNKIENQPIDWFTLTMQNNWHLGAARMAVIEAKKKRMLQVETIKGWQAVIVKDQANHGYQRLPEQWIGKYRNIDVTVSGRLGTKPGKIADEMTLWLEDVICWHKHQADPLQAVAHSHYVFEQIHPFADGNGRTGRLIALYMCYRLGIKPVLFTAVDRRAEYYPCFGEPDSDRMYEYCKSHQVEVTTIG